MIFTPDLTPIKLHSIINFHQCGEQNIPPNRKGLAKKIAMVVYTYGGPSNSQQAELRLYLA
jgi:hypothetical protein